MIIDLIKLGAGSGPLQWVFLGELLPPDYKVMKDVCREENEKILW